MIAKPITRSPSRATSDTVSGSSINWRMRSPRYCQPSPVSIRSRDMDAIAGASPRQASCKVMSRELTAAILPCPRLRRNPLPRIMSFGSRALGNRVRPPSDSAMHPARQVSRRRALALIGTSGALWLAASRPRPASAQAAAGAPACVVRPEQTEGPFFVDEALNRSDIRSDPRTGQTSAGVPLRLVFNLSRTDGPACAPLRGVQVDLWHSDATGRYSDVSGFGYRPSTVGQQFLRGYQLTNAAGSAQFLTIFPGWYAGRAVHLHFKIRLVEASAPGFSYTSQLYFDDALTE